MSEKVFYYNGNLFPKTPLNPDQKFADYWMTRNLYDYNWGMRNANVDDLIQFAKDYMKYKGYDYKTSNP